MPEMQYRQLGGSGLSVSLLGLGCNNFGGRVTDVDVVRSVVDAALDAGVTLLDTSDTYGNGGGSESLLDEVLQGRRDEVVLATKFGGGPPGEGYPTKAGRHWLRRSLEASLRRLRTDHVDLYQLHVPDGRTPLSETIAALDEVVRAGLVRYVGTSNLPAWRVVEAELTARHGGWERPVSAQNHYSLLAREVEAELIPALEAHRIGLLPYFPLANGLLTGKYRRGEAPPAGTRLGDDAEWAREELTPERFDRVEGLQRVADEAGVSLLTLAVGVLAARPVVSSVIAGATRPEQVLANVEAASWVPAADVLAAVDAVAPGPTPVRG